MAKRVQSPSSIKTFLQCPRKYYYQYIEELPTSPSIHTVRGTITHAVLEDFFDQDVTCIETITQAQTIFRTTIQQLLVQKWRDHEAELTSLGIPQEQLITYFEETFLMLLNWLTQFMERLRALEKPVDEAFKTLTPLREKEYLCAKYQVRGFIDAIEHVAGTIRIMDYKTNKATDIEDHKLQLGIYSLMYMEEHGRMPDFAGIYFLRTNEETIPVDLTLLEDAKQKILYTHERTASEHKTDYPLRISKLCNWGAGQCDFYPLCFGKKTSDELTPLRKTAPPATNATDHS